MTHSKPAVGMPLPLISLPKLGGGTIDIGGARGRHMLLVVYRGKHCGRCKKYLTSLDGMAGDWEAAGFDIVTCLPTRWKRRRPIWTNMAGGSR